MSSIGEGTFVQKKPVPAKRNPLRSVVWIAVVVLSWYYAVVLMASLITVPLFAAIFAYRTWWLMTFGQIIEVDAWEFVWGVLQQSFALASIPALLAVVIYIGTTRRYYLPFPWFHRMKEWASPANISH